MKIIPYVFVHDQNIVLAYERTRKLSKIFNEYYYVFLGNNPVYEIKNKKNVIVARQLEYNIEEYPKLVTFTGWYALHMNKLLKSDYSMFLEYDVVLHPRFSSIVLDSIKHSKEKDVFSFIPVAKDFLFYEYLLPIIDNKENFSSDREIYIDNGGKEQWMGSSNSIWKTEVVIDFIEWFMLRCGAILNYDTIGHIVERALTMYCIENRINYRFISGVLQHEYLDSHQTQSVYNGGIQKNYKDHINRLAQS